MQKHSSAITAAWGCRHPLHSQQSPVHLCPSSGSEYLYNSWPHLQRPIQHLCPRKSLFLKMPCTSWILVPVVPHYQLPNLLRMARHGCTEQPKELPALWGWLLSQGTGTILDEIGKRKHKNLLCHTHWWIQLHCIGGEKICEGRLRWQRAFIRQGTLAATAHSAANSQVPDRPWWLLHLLGCLNPMGPGAGGSGSTGSTGTQGLLWGSGAGPLSPRAGSQCSLCLPGSARPSHTITPQTHLKLHRCCRTGRTERENILYCHIPPTHPFQLLAFPFSAQLVLSPPGCRSQGKKGICLLWQKPPLL